MLITRFLLCNLFSTLLIWSIVVLKKVLGHRVSLRFHYHIWLVLLLSLTAVLIPVRMTNSFLIGRVVDEITQNHEITADSTQPAPDMPDDTWKYDIAEITEKTNQSHAGKIFEAIWLLGTIGVLGYYFLGSRRVKRIQRFSEPVDEQIQKIFGTCCKSVGVKQLVQLRQSDQIDSPMSFGYRQAYVFLPTCILLQFSEREFGYIISHELNHIKHKDIWLNYVLCFMQAVYWINPFVWWAFSKMQCDREAYCDWMVLNQFCEEEDRLWYGYTLLHFAGKKEPADIYIVNHLCHGKQQIKYRLEQIVDFKKETRRSNAIGRAVLAVFLVASMIQIPAMSVFLNDTNLFYTPDSEMQIVEQDYSRYFPGASGCAVIYDSNSDKYLVYNPSESTTRIAPCSTCKIYSALNALEQGVITPDDNMVRWDNISRELPEWNHNQNLESAMKNSANWYFQYLDECSGAQELEEFYRRIGYGNGYIGNNITYYWNGSKLKISPLEQVELLKKLYENGFGFQQENIDTVKSAIFISEYDGNKLYGKTGTGRVGEDDVNGWFIGYIEATNNTYFFSVSVQAESNANGAAASQIAASIFKEMGIIIDS